MESKISLLIATILCALIPLTSPNVDTSSTTLYVNPPTTLTGAGKNFTISLDVAHVADLAGYNIYLGYNTTVLTATNIEVDGTWLTTGRTYTVWDKTINEVKGVVHVSLTLTGVEEGVTGSGDLIRIDFVADAPGSSPLDTYNDTLVDPLFNAIPHSTIDGAVFVTIAGDIDGDGDVDSDDFYLFAGAYGSSPPSNPNCDIDNDGDVDSDDFYIFAGNYGKIA